MSKARIITILFSTLIALAKSFNYCQLSCDDNTNTVCERSNECGPIPPCTELPIHWDFRTAMLDAHNSIRNRAALGDGTGPETNPIGDMQVLSYDLELEHVAKCWANTCEGGNDKCRLTKKFWKRVTQNYVKLDLTGDWRDLNYTTYDVVGRWYKEGKKWSEYLSYSSYVPDESTSNYSQLVWSTTTHVGCARSKLQRSIFVYCNYGPGGNIKGAPVFNKAYEPCSKCAKRQFCNEVYPGLCGVIHEMSKSTSEDLEFYKYLSVFVLVAIGWNVDM